MPAATQRTALAPSSVSAASTGVRLGLLFGPAVFGVTAAGVALPRVAEELAVSPTAAVWILTAHALALGVGTALFGRVADARGVTQTLVIGVGLVGLGTLVCLAAPNLGLVVAGRLLLAAGSGALSTCALTLAASTEPAGRPRVLSWFGATMACFAASATLAGGAVTQYLSWRLTIVLPALAVVGAALVRREAAARTGTRRRLDLVGAGLLTATSASLVVLVQARTLPWQVVAVLVTVLLAGGALLVAWSRRRPSGFVPVHVVRDRTYLTAALIGSGVYAGLFATMYVVPQSLVGEGLAVLHVGVALLPGAVVAAVASRLAGRLAMGRAARWVLAALPAAAGISMVVPAGGLGGLPALVVAASLCLAAFAVTQVMTTGLVSARIPVESRGVGIGLLNLCFFIGGAVGSAAAGALSASLDLRTTLALTALAPLLAGVVAVSLRTPEG